MKNRRSDREMTSTLDTPRTVRALRSKLEHMQRCLDQKNQELQQLQAKLGSESLRSNKSTPASPAPAPAGALPAEAYRTTVGRIRELVNKSLPSNSTVLVVSRGDDELLRLGGTRRGWHFPQNAQGVYLGHHPADSAKAIEHLEELRARGGQY